MLPVRHDTRGRVYSESTAVDARHSGNRLQVPDSPVFPGFRGFQPSKFQGNGGIGSPRFPIRPETGFGVPGEAGRGHRGLRVTPSGGGPFDKTPSARFALTIGSCVRCVYDSTPAASQAGGACQRLLDKAPSGPAAGPWALAGWTHTSTISHGASLSGGPSLCCRRCIARCMLNAPQLRSRSPTSAAQAAGFGCRAAVRASVHGPPESRYIPAEQDTEPAVTQRQPGEARSRASLVKGCIRARPRPARAFSATLAPDTSRLVRNEGLPDATLGTRAAHLSRQPEKRKRFRSTDDRQEAML